VAPEENVADLRQRLECGQVQWIAAFSGSAVRNLLALLPDIGIRQGVRLATIGSATSSQAKRLGLVVAAQATQPDARSLVAAIIAAETLSGTSSER
ncbi:MAG: uroporphyrinogen-III synthase, partial [Cyanobacteria bacterium REEB65]|nr:uroporphyrinogen-III synthase [Cyanobacteria bacterium REEB65]